MTVDWRNRFGYNWVPSVRNQGNAPNCWAFGLAALYETMVRIEHCLWCRRSEGDLARGTGKQPWDFGNYGEAANFAQIYGIADPDCFPWSEAACLYVAEADVPPDYLALPISTTPDRSGRTVKVGKLEITNDVQFKKLYIDTVGPMAVMMNLPDDFGGYSGNIYSPTLPPGPSIHALLVVGFDDSRQCWIVKNSWGEHWGESGYVNIGYSANLLESATFYGVRHTNPDPWTKRRYRNGVMVETSKDTPGNIFEIFVKVGLKLMHAQHDPSKGFGWTKPKEIRYLDIHGTPGWRDTFHDDAVDMPSVVQSTFNRNFEVIYRTTFNKLRHVYFNQNSGIWEDAKLFGPEAPAGVPGFIQSNRGAPGDFEVVVQTASGSLEHWTKHNSAPWNKRPGEWYRKSIIFNNSIKFAGAGLIQSKSITSNEIENGSGELHYVCTAVNGMMVHFICSSTYGTWLPALNPTFGNGITSAPCLIQGQNGTNNELEAGNFELCVEKKGRIEHWSRQPVAGATWMKSTTFGSDVNRVVSLMQSSFGFNLELIVERTDGRYQHYWREESSQMWIKGLILF